MTSKRLDFYKKLLLKTPSHIRRTRPSLLDYPPKLRGLPNNKYVVIRRSIFTALKVVRMARKSRRQYTPEEIKMWEQDRRE